MLLLLQSGILTFLLVDGQTYTVTTLAGSGTAGYLEGIGTTASFNNPQGVAFGPDGMLYVSDDNNNVVRKLDLRTDRTSLLANGFNTIKRK